MTRGLRALPILLLLVACSTARPIPCPTPCPTPCSTP